MNATPKFSMTDSREDTERLEARLRSNARDFARAAGDQALISVVIGIMREAQGREAGRGRAR